jgi:hypothetical protein
VPRIIISDQFLIWSELFALWSIVSYGITADPLPEDADAGTFKMANLALGAALRIVVAAVFSYWICHSVIASAWLATLIAIQPWSRFRSPKKWTAELEILVVVLNLLFVFAFIRHLDLHMHSHLSLPISREQISAISIVSGVLLFVIRGGTYIVRGCLRKTETLPKLSIDPQAATAIATAADGDTGTKRLDLVEINRGRLIGNLERLVLTLVVVAGSYAALGFLVAAKGLIRSEELQEREFAEYFLVGSLCSVLVALCAGLVIRYTLLAAC